MSRKSTKESGISRMVAFSLLLHVTMFGTIYKVGYFISPNRPESQTYYVDVVNLPVANPQSGTPSTSEKSSPSPPPPTRQEMNLPPRSTKNPALPEAAHAVKKEQKTVEKLETRDEFAERLARLEKKAEGKRLGEALDAIRKKTDAGGNAGMPGAKGKESGSDYASYIQSRLRDAFNDTIAFQSRNPEIVIKLRINRLGKVIGYHIERSSRDKLFESSVARAISIAGENFPPPPGGGDFEHGFIFRPEGVGKK